MAKRGAARGEAKTLGMDDVFVAPWFNARQRGDAADDERLRSSLDDDGQHTALVVCAMADARALLAPFLAESRFTWLTEAWPNAALLLRMSRASWFLVAGFRRFEQLRTLGAPDCMVTIQRHAAIADLIVANLAENTARRALAVVDLARRCKVLRELGLSADTIASRLSLSRVYVFQLVAAVEGLAGPVMRAWDAPRPPSFELIREWSSLGHGEQIRRLQEWRGFGSPHGERCDGPGCARAKFHLGTCGPRTRLSTKPGVRARRRALGQVDLAITEGRGFGLGGTTFAEGIRHALRWTAGIDAELVLVKPRVSLLQAGDSLRPRSPAGVTRATQGRRGRPGPRRP